tara:strand:+ start:2021 stop:2539 length:519 start_codon:yes stop_codon:yes gene_type:complete
MAIYYGDGSNSNSGRVLGQKHSFNQSRSSMNGNPNNQDVDLWNMLTYSKISSTSTMIVQAHITMHHDYSYPYYGTLCKATWNSGAGVYRNRSGCNYSIGKYADSNQVIWKILTFFTAANLSNQTGNITFYASYTATSGQTGNKPGLIFNPNSNDDNRGFQKASTCNVYEVEP